MCCTPGRRPPELAVNVENVSRRDETKRLEYHLDIQERRGWITRAAPHWEDRAYVTLLHSFAQQVR